MIGRIIVILLRITGILFPFYLWWLFHHYRAPNFLVATGIYSFLAVSFSFVVWWLLELLDVNRHRDWKMGVLPDKEELRAMRLAKYEHLNDEIIRYRDLSWKIPTLAYGIYWGARALLSEAALGDGLICFFYSLTAICATIFLLFCEHAVYRNKPQRREIEETMKLDSEWRYKISVEGPIKPRFLVSVGIFLLAIWIPPWIMFFYRG